MKSLAAVVTAGLALAVSGGAAHAQISDDVVKIGVLTDMSSLYADATGKGSLAAVQMAVADYGGKVKDKPVEVIAADHQNKPDVGVAIARNWYDNEKVDAIFDVPTSSVALPVSALTREKNKIHINSGGGSSDITGIACSPNTVHWTYDTYALGVKATQGLIVTDAFYWDMNDETRAFSKRFNEKVGHMPTMIQAGLYSATMHYLKAIEAIGTDEAPKVMAQMRSTPINDFFAHGGKIRIDGRMVHDMYLFEVKKPEESKGEWDLYKLIATVPGDEAFRPLDKGGCPLVKTN